MARRKAITISPESMGKVKAIAYETGKHTQQVVSELLDSVDIMACNEVSGMVYTNMLVTPERLDKIRKAKVLGITVANLIKAALEQQEK